jgi:hypothetical protein
MHTARMKSLSTLRQKHLAVCCLGVPFLFSSDLGEIMAITLRAHKPEGEFRFKSGGPTNSGELNDH